MSAIETRFAQRHSGSLILQIIFLSFSMLSVILRNVIMLNVCLCHAILLTVYVILEIVNVKNGKEATINRALDGSTYPS
jgi:hypothetical protein